MADRSTRFAFVIATFFGSGYSPVAPGTAGTAATVLLVLLIAPLGNLVYWVVTAALIALSFWASDKVVRSLGREDPGIIVIDETVGYLLTVGLVTRDWPQLAAGFVLFRLADILKPWPIRWLDRNVKGGVGVVLDDVAAGAVAAVILILIEPKLIEWLG